MTTKLKFVQQCCKFDDFLKVRRCFFHVFIAVAVMVCGCHGIGRRCHYWHWPPPQSIGGVYNCPLNCSLQHLKATLEKHSWRLYSSDSLPKPIEVLQNLRYVGVAPRACAVSSALDKGKGRALFIAPQVDTATTEALRYMARTKQRRTYLPLNLPSHSRYPFIDLKGWRVE